MEISTSIKCVSYNIYHLPDGIKMVKVFINISRKRVLWQNVTVCVGEMFQVKNITTELLWWCVCYKNNILYMELLGRVEDDKGDGGLVDGSLEGTLDDRDDLAVRESVETARVDLEDLLPHLESHP